MQGQLLAPGVEYGQNADASTQVLGIGSDLQQGLRRTLEQQVVQQPRMAQRQRVELFRKGEDHVEVGHWQQLGAALFQPALFLQALALRAVTVAAGVVDDLARSAVGTLVDMSAQSGGPARLDGSQGPQVGTAELAVILFTESG